MTETTPLAQQLADYYRERQHRAVEMRNLDDLTAERNIAQQDADDQRHMKEVAREQRDRVTVILKAAVSLLTDMKLAADQGELSSSWDARQFSERIMEIHGRYTDSSKRRVDEDALTGFTVTVWPVDGSSMTRQEFVYPDRDTADRQAAYIAMNGVVVDLNGSRFLYPVHNIAKVVINET